MVTKDIGGKIGVFYWNYLAFYMIAYEISIGLDDHARERQEAEYSKILFRQNMFLTAR